MSWNYRVMKTTTTRGVDTEESFGIYEVYYKEDNTTIEYHTSDPVEPCGDTLEELQNCLRWMMEATEKPVINLPVFKKSGHDD